MFAIITVALLAGAVAECTRFRPWLVFVAAWVTVVYLPLAHWVFDPNGWLVAKVHLLDFAGGTAVEGDSGAASLALALVVGKRLGWPKEQARPHNLPAVMLGAGIVWFGWFGFNAGSALAASGLAATALISTTFVIAAVVDRTLGLRVTPEAEPVIDEAEHAETAYDQGRFGPSHIAVGAAKPPHG